MKAKPQHLDKERLQAAIDFAHLQSQVWDLENRTKIRAELQAQRDRAILAGITQPWED